MSDKKTGTIGSRIAPSLRLRLNEISRRFGPTDAVMLNDALLALCNYVEVEGHYRRPMMMVFDAATDEQQRLMLAESAGPAPTAAAAAAIQRLHTEEKARAGRRPAVRK